MGRIAAPEGEIRVQQQGGQAVCTTKQCRWMAFGKPSGDLNSPDYTHPVGLRVNYEAPQNWQGDRGCQTWDKGGQAKSAYLT